MHHPDSMLRIAHIARHERLEAADRRRTIAALRRTRRRASHPSTPTAELHVCEPRRA